MTAAAPAPPPASPLDFGTFRSLLATWLQRDLGSSSPDSLLHDDLEFDSLTMAEVCVFFAEQGIDLPDELVTELRTLADLHHYFVVLGPRVPAPGPHTTGPPSRSFSGPSSRAVAR